MLLTKLRVSWKSSYKKPPARYAQRYRNSKPSSAAVRSQDYTAVVMQVESFVAQQTALLSKAQQDHEQLMRDMEGEQRYG